ncbi:hypothetical protein ABK040_003645 [Willaertia magna]
MFFNKRKKNSSDNSASLPYELTLEGNLPGLLRTLDKCICQTPQESQKFERDLMRMLHAIVLTRVRRKTTENIVDAASESDDELILEEIPFKSSTENTSLPLLRDALNGLGSLLYDKAFTNFSLQDIQQVYLFEYLEEDELKRCLSALLSDAYPSLLRLISGVAQVVVVSAMSKLVGCIVFSKQPFQPKDVRKTWSIQFRRYEEGADEDGCLFSIIHQRTESIMKTIDLVLLEPMFNFTWQIELKFKTLDITRIDTIVIRLLKIDWDIPVIKNNNESLSPTIPPSYSDEEKQNAENTFKQFFSNQFVDYGYNTNEKKSGKTVFIFSQDKSSFERPDKVLVEVKHNVDSIVVEKKAVDLSKIEVVEPNSPRQQQGVSPRTPGRKNRLFNCSYTEDDSLDAYRK